MDTAYGIVRASFTVMSHIADRLKQRTMRFALDVCALIKPFSFDEPEQTVKRQLTRAATSVAFNYRAACRGRSHSEYTAKIGLVAEESDESLGWLEFIEGAGLLKSNELRRLIEEAHEIARSCQPRAALPVTTSATEDALNKQSPINPPVPQSPNPQSPIIRLPDSPIHLSLSVGPDRPTTRTMNQRTASRP